MRELMRALMRHARTVMRNTMQGPFTEDDASPAPLWVQVMCPTSDEAQ